LLSNYCYNIFSILILNLNLKKNDSSSFIMMKNIKYKGKTQIIGTIQNDNIQFYYETNVYKQTQFIT